jgi:hypothetical protein
MTQIIPATRSDDSKFSWSRSTVTFSRPIRFRACFHFLTPDVHPRAAILSAVPVELPNVKWIPVQLAATRFSKVLRAPCAARCFVRREYERHHSQTRTMILTCIEPTDLLLTLPADFWRFTLCDKSRAAVNSGRSFLHEIFNASRPLQRAGEAHTLSSC